MKKIIILLTIVIAVVAGAFWFITSDKLNLLIAEQIELQGSKFTEQAVTVKSVDMKVLQGAGTINGLVLNNPKGYSATPAFSLNTTTLDINITSLADAKNGGAVIIDEIIIVKPEALVEFSETGGSNIQEILDAINKNLPKSSTAKDATQAPTSNDNMPKVRVKKFVLAGVALRVDLTKLGNTTHKKTLPNIELTNIGGDAGLPADQLGGTMLKEVLSAIWKEAKKSQKKVLEDKLKEKAKDKIKDKTKDLLNKFTKD